LEIVPPFLLYTKVDPELYINVDVVATIAVVAVLATSMTPPVPTAVTLFVVVKVEALFNLSVPLIVPTWPAVEPKAISNVVVVPILAAEPASTSSAVSPAALLNVSTLLAVAAVNVASILFINLSLATVWVGILLMVVVGVTEPLNVSISVTSGIVLAGDQLLPTWKSLVAPCQT
jgi:hypothetical protein